MKVFDERLVRLEVVFVRWPRLQFSIATWIVGNDTGNLGTRVWGREEKRRWYVHTVRAAST